jgi:hypothetical protein
MYVFIYRVQDGYKFGRLYRWAHCTCRLGSIFCTTRYGDLSLCGWLVDLRMPSHTYLLVGLTRSLVIMRAVTVTRRNLQISVRLRFTVQGNLLCDGFWMINYKHFWLVEGYSSLGRHDLSRLPVLLYRWTPFRWRFRQKLHFLQDAKKIR